MYGFAHDSVHVLKSKHDQRTRFSVYVSDVITTCHMYTKYLVRRRLCPDEPIGDMCD